MDCSNFSSWAYNYGLGIKFTTAIAKQADGPEAPGSLIARSGPFKKGDLLFLPRPNGECCMHVFLYIDDANVIDAADGGIHIRPFAGLYQSTLLHARRVIEDTP